MRNNKHTLPLRSTAAEFQKNYRFFQLLLLCEWTHTPCSQVQANEILDGPLTSRGDDDSSNPKMNAGGRTSFLLVTPSLREYVRRIRVSCLSVELFVSTHRTVYKCSITSVSTTRTDSFWHNRRTREQERDNRERGGTRKTITVSVLTVLGDCSDIFKTLD